MLTGEMPTYWAGVLFLMEKFQGVLSLSSTLMKRKTPDEADIGEQELCLTATSKQHVLPHLPGLRNISWLFIFKSLKQQGLKGSVRLPQNA